MNWQELTIDSLESLPVGTLFMVRSEVWANEHKVRKMAADLFRVYQTPSFDCSSCGFHPASNFETIELAIIKE